MHKTNANTNSKIDRFKVIKTSTHTDELVRLPEGFSANILYPSAVYTTIRTYHRSTGQTLYLYLEKHIQRLNDSLAIGGSPLRVDSDQIKQALRLVEGESQLKNDLRIKIIFNPLESGELFIDVEPLITPKEVEYIKGVSIFTVHYVRSNPEAKNYGFVKSQDQIRSEISEDAAEILMLGANDEILEGLSSNFFCVIGEMLRTADKGILHGVTRQIVLDVAASHSVLVSHSPVCLRDLEHAVECFITSTSRGILPVTRIDQKVIGTGTPGPITCKLMSWFDSEIERLVKPL